VQHWLGRPLQPASLIAHYADEAFAGMHGVEELRGCEGDFWIVTGQATHFLLSSPEELACPFHDFGHAREQQRQALEAPWLTLRSKGLELFSQMESPIIVATKTYPVQSMC